MRLRTVAVLAVVVVALLGVGAAALWWTGGSGGALTELWVSDTARQTEFNHHGVGVGVGERVDTGESAALGETVVVAPVLDQSSQSERSQHSCALVRLAPENGSVGWRYGVPPDRCFVHSLTKPTIADLDGTGAPEVIAGTVENETVVLDAADGRERFAIEMGTYSYGEPVVADVLGDDDPEIVTSDIGGNVVVTDDEGTVQWRATVAGSVWAPPAVVDVDGDDRVEVVVGGGDETVAFERDGSVLWRRAVSGNELVAAPTGDGVRVVAAGFGDVVGLDGATGETAWNRSVAGSPALAALGDGDGDNRPEAYVGAANGVVHAFDAVDGSTDWRTTLVTGASGATPPPTLADLSGDGSLELVAPTRGGTVVVLDPADGSELAAYERATPIWTGVTAADISDSAGEEILVRYGDGRVVALEYDA